MRFAGPDFDLDGRWLHVRRRRWAALGDIRAIRVGRRGRYRFRASEIQRLLESDREEVAA